MLRGGTILTMEEDNPQAEALAVKDERILAVGSNQEIGAYVGPPTEIIDLKGGLAVPGLIDGHGHFMSLGESLMGLDLRHPATWGEIVALVEKAAEGIRTRRVDLGTRVAPGQMGDTSRAQRRRVTDAP